MTQTLDLSSALGLRVANTDALALRIANTDIWTAGPSYTPWTEVRRNLFADPRASSTNSSFWGTTGGSTSSLVTFNDGTATWARGTRTGTGAIRIIDMKVGNTMLPSTEYRLRLRIKSSANLGGLVIQYRPSVTLTNNAVSSPSLSLTPTAQVVDWTFTTPAATTGSNTGFTIAQGSGTVGFRIDITEVMVVRTPYTGGHFDGWTTDTDTERYEWLGTADASQSTMETRTLLP